MLGVSSVVGTVVSSSVVVSSVVVDVVGRRYLGRSDLFVYGVLLVVVDKGLL